MKKINFMMCIAAIAVSLQACSGSKKSSSSDSTTVKTDSTTMTTTKTDSSASMMADTTFASKAAVGGMAEVALGKMAASKAATARSKTLAT